MAKKLRYRLREYFNNQAYIYRPEIRWAGIGLSAGGILATAVGLGTEEAGLAISGMASQYAGMKLTGIEALLEVYK